MAVERLLTIEQQDGKSIALPVEKFELPQPEPVEFQWVGQACNILAPASSVPGVVIGVATHVTADTLEALRAWRDSVYDPNALFAACKRKGTLVVRDTDTGATLASMEVFGIWPQCFDVCFSESDDLRVVVTFIVDCVEDMPEIEFKQPDLDEDLKVEITEALTPKGIETLERFGATLVGG